MRTRIKLCGFTRISDLRQADRLGADAIGLNFYPSSPRSVTPKQAAELAGAVGGLCTRVALFVDPTESFVEEVLRRVPIDVLQFHGKETPEFCAHFGRPWIKALRVREDSELEAELSLYQGAASILLDAYKPGVPGGTGESFNWNLIPERWRSRILLAGGLNPANVFDAVRRVRPQGVDVSGGIEAAKGVKSHEKMTEFVRQVALADAEREIYDH